MNATDRVPARIPAILAALAEPSRLKVVTVLIEGDFCVSEVADRVGLSQSCTTRHLQSLQRAGVLTRSRAGKRVLFRLREGDAELMRILELLALRQPLDAADRSTTETARSAPVRRPRTASPSPPKPRVRDVAGEEAADAVTIPITAHAASDMEAASDSPSDAVHDASQAVSPPAVGEDTELEDYLL